MTLSQRLKDYHFTLAPRVPPNLKGMRHVQADDGFADHFIDPVTRVQYFRISTRSDGRMVWMQVTRKAA